MHHPLAALLSAPKAHLRYDTYSGPTDTSMLLQGQERKFETTSWLIQNRGVLLINSLPESLLISLNKRSQSGQVRYLHIHTAIKTVNGISKLITPACNLLGIS